MKQSALVLVAALLQAPSVSAQQRPGSSTPTIDYETVRRSRIITATRIAEGIVLDGRLDEPVWRQVDVATDFIQLMPRPGEPSRLRTEVRFVYDDTNLYIAVTCFQPPDVPMVLNELTEDFNFGQSDALNLVLDTLPRSAFGLHVHDQSRRREADGQIANDGEIGNIDWDGVWDVKVTRTRKGGSPISNPVQDAAVHGRRDAGMGIQPDAGNPADQRGKPLGADSDPFRATRVSARRHASRLEDIRQGRNLNIAVLRRQPEPGSDRRTNGTIAARRLRELTAA